MITFLTKLSSQPWLMETNWFRVGLNILSRNPPSLGLNGEFKEKIEKRALSLGDGKQKNLNFVEKRGNIGILNIRGPVVRYAGMMELSADVRSLESYTKDFKVLENDPNIDVIVLNIDSPGGEAAGISQFATYIRNSPKKVVSYIDDLGASAAYWIASAAKNIYASTTAFVGSIGVVYTIIDDSEKQKKDGIEKIEIVSTQSPNKRPDIKTDEGKQQIQVWADDLANKFVKAVASYRGVSEDYVLENFGKGNILIAEKAKDVKMIDGIMTFEKLLKNLSNQTNYKKGARMEENRQITPDVIKNEHPQAYEEIFQAGAEAERNRIQAIEDLGVFSGYEEVVKNMKFDGKSNAEMVELAVFRAERENKTKIASNFNKDGAKAAALLAEAGVGMVETTEEQEKKTSPYAKVLEKIKRS
jgi:signal peptide peptidase SppA